MIPAADQPATRNPVRAARASHRPEFRKVLDAALSNASSAVVNPEKSVWLTLRVSGSEQALIQARAAEARLSVSAYLRQCAFEVEALRSDLQRALLEMQSPVRQLASPAVPEPAALRQASIFTGLALRVTRLFGLSPRFSLSA